MAGNELCIARQDHTGLRLQHAHGSERRSDQSRLGIFGQRQGFGRPLPHHRTELVAQRIVHFLEDASSNREGLRQSLAHADRLAALPRKHIRRQHAQTSLRIGALRHRHPAAVNHRW
jgi:hypothetical protein